MRSSAPDGLVWCNANAHFFAVTPWPELRVYRARLIGDREHVWEHTPHVPDRRVRLNLRREYRMATDDPAIEVETFLRMPWLRWNPAGSRTQRRVDFVAQLPAEVLRTVLPYPRHHLSLLRLAASHPHAAELLQPWPAGAPALALALATRIARCIDADAVRSLCWLARRKRRALATALGLPHSPYAVRLMGRAAAPALTRTTFSDLLHAAQHPHSALHTRHARTLHPAVLAVAASDCLRPLLTPTLVRELNLPQLDPTKTVDALVAVRAALGDPGHAATARARRRWVRPIHGLAELDARMERVRVRREAAQRRGKDLRPATSGTPLDDEADDARATWFGDADAAARVYGDPFANWEHAVTNSDAAATSRWSMGDAVLQPLSSPTQVPNDGTVERRDVHPHSMPRFVSYALHEEQPDGIPTSGTALNWTPRVTVLLEQHPYGVRLVGIQRADGAPITVALRERVRAAVHALNERFG